MSRESAPTDHSGVEVAGPPDGQPVVFVHGVVFTRKMWVPQRDDLADDVRYVSMDLPGHGDVADGDDFRLDDAVERLDEVIEREADGRATVVGLSLGGYVATEYARRYPEKVETLVISGSSVNLDGIMEKVTRGVSWISNKITASSLGRRAMSGLHARFVKALDLEERTEREVLDAGFFPRQLGKAGYEIAGRDFRAAFAAYPGPALVLNGKWDLLNRLGEEKHADAARDTTVAVIPGTGHVCNLEKPEAYSGALRALALGESRESVEQRAD
jgi:pimeloyl-ACP methyl ester carboxylesterase